MKKKLAALLEAVSLCTATASANDTELFFRIGSFDAALNGEKISSYSYLSDSGNTMVEIRTVSETLGCKVSWNGETREVGISDDGLEMRLKIDSDKAEINGSTVKMTEPAVIRNDKTLVPIRFVSESFGAEVGYNHDEKTVTVSGRSYEGRIKWLREAEPELMTSYYNAVKSWLMVTDTEISEESFANVWNSLVNTMVMELLPGRALSAEICEKYRVAAQMGLDDRYTVEKSDGYIKITSKDKEVSFVYNPKSRTLTLNGKLPSVIHHGGGSGGGGGSKATPAPTATVIPETTATALPTETPEATATPMPTETELPDIAPTASAEPTATPEATEGPTDVAPTSEPSISPRPTSRPSGGGAGGGDYTEETESPDVTEPPTASEPPEETEPPTVTEPPNETELPTASEPPEESIIIPTQAVELIIFGNKRRTSFF